MSFFEDLEIGARREIGSFTFTADDIKEMRESWPNAEILAHPECPAEVLEAADFAGSTGAMIDFVKSRKPKQVVLITECSMSADLACELPDTCVKIG